MFFCICLVFEQVAYSMLKGGDAGEDPIDAHYKKLKTDIVPLEKKSEEYDRLVTYVKNTHAATHNMYDLEVEEVRLTFIMLGQMVRGMIMVSGHAVCMSLHAFHIACNLLYKVLW